MSLHRNDDPLAHLGRAPTAREHDLTPTTPTDLVPDTPDPGLGLVEGYRTSRAIRQARGEMARRHGEAAVKYRGETLELAERLKADVQKQRLLIGARDVAGKLERESLAIADKIDRQQIEDTVDSIAENTRLRNRSHDFVKDAVARNEFDEADGAELNAVVDMLTNEAKRSTLDRHERLRKRREDQFAQASEFEERFSPKDKGR